LELGPLLISLNECQILLTANESVRFRHKYVYYYFVASWIRDHITETEILDIIRRLANRLHIEDNANILMFLVHLSRDPVIVQERLGRARSLHPLAMPAKLEEDVQFLVELAAGQPEPVFIESDPSENRR